jgi:hypothetical protein
MQLRPLMHLSRSFLAGVAIAVAVAPACLAQSASNSSMAPERQVHFDVSGIGLNVGFAARTSPRTSFGVAVGVGGNWWNYMVLGGRHFSESNGLSYTTKDGSTDKALYELVRGTIFVRRHFDGGRQLDLGLKASGFLHSDNSDDDPGGGIFIGANLTGMWWQWRRLRLGSELDIGAYSEGRPEFGINVAPVLVRLTIP